MARANAALDGASSDRVRLGQSAIDGERRRFSVDLSDVEDQRPAVRATVEQIAAAPESQRRAELACTGYLAPTGRRRTDWVPVPRCSC